MENKFTSKLAKYKPAVLEKYKNKNPKQLELLKNRYLKSIIFTNSKTPMRPKKLTHRYDILSPILSSDASKSILHQVESITPLKGYKPTRKTIKLPPIKAQI